MCFSELAGMARKVAINTWSTPNILLMSFTNMDSMEENVESASAYSGVLQRRSLHQTQYVPFGSPLRREAREEKWESQRNQINSDKEPTPEKRRTLEEIKRKKENAETKNSKTNKPKRNNYKLQDRSNGADPAVYSASVNGINAQKDEDKGCVGETGQFRKDPKLTLTDALVQDDSESVEPFLKNEINLSQVLDISDLRNLYLKCFKDKDDVSARLLRKRINKLRFIEGLKQALCCGCAKDNERRRPDLLNYIGNVIADLLGNKNINMYPVQGNEQLKIRAKHLFIWAVLMNRMSLAKFFWRIGSDYIETALFASCLLKKLSKMASDEYEQDLSESLTRHSSKYEKVASKVLDKCYLQDRFQSKQLLIREMSEFGNTTLFSLAEENKLMDFMGRTCCQAKLEEIWKDVIPLSTSRKMIVASIFMPLLISAKLFVENKLDDLNPLCTNAEELMPEHQDDAFRDEKVTSSPDSKTQEGVGHHWCCEKAKECFQDICSFYTAPVTKFITTMYANIVFLGLFSFFVLTDLHPIGENGAPSLVEIFTWIYAINGVMDEINQVVTRNHGSIWYNIRSWLRSTWNWFDIAIYLSFLTSVILRLSLYGKDFIWARMLYSLTLGMCFFRLLQYFDADQNIGPKVTMISRMLNDLRFFLLILVVFILSFGVTYHANLYPNASQQWSVLKDVLYYPYWQMFGELSLENIEGNEPSEDAGTCTKNETLWRSGKMERCPEKSFLAVLVMAAFLLLTNVLLLNLLIAMFSDTVKKVHDNSEKEWRFHRFSLVYEYYNKPFLFQPLNILVYIFWPFRRHFCKEDSFRMKLNEKELPKLQRKAMKKYKSSWWTLDNEKIKNKLKTIVKRVDRVNENVDEIKEKVNNLWWRHQKLNDR